MRAHHSALRTSVFRLMAYANANEYTRAHVTARDGNDDVLVLRTYWHVCTHERIDVVDE